MMKQAPSLDDQISDDHLRDNIDFNFYILMRYRFTLFKSFLTQSKSQILVESISDLREHWSPLNNVNGSVFILIYHTKPQSVLNMTWQQLKKERYYQIYLNLLKKILSSFKFFDIFCVTNFS